MSIIVIIIRGAGVAWQIRGVRCNNCRAPWVYHNAYLNIVIPRLRHLVSIIFLPPIQIIIRRNALGGV